MVVSCAGDIVRCGHLNSIIIPKVEDVDAVSVVHPLITIIHIFDHELYFVIHKTLYLFIIRKYVTLEVQCIDTWYTSVLNYILNTGKSVPCLWFPSIITKRLIPVKVHVFGII